MKKSSINIPNILSLMRCFLVPVFVLSLILLRDFGFHGYVVPAFIYIITGLTDMLDGKIARKYGLITDFGKFIDPLADKFMVLGSMFAILLWMVLRAQLMQALIFVWLCLIVLLRELAVTSLRLVVAGKEANIDLAANIFGKLKTVSQMVGTVLIILEPLFLGDNHILSYVMMGIMAFTTIGSGIGYFKAYMPYINTNE